MLKDKQSFLDDEQVRSAVKKYLTEDTTVERACFILKDGTVRPFNNTARTPINRIAADPESMSEFAKHYFNDDVFGWAHSHPHWAARPSVEDVTCHEYCLHMIIYSVRDNEFGIWSSTEIAAMKNDLTDYLITK